MTNRVDAAIEKLEKSIDQVLSAQRPTTLEEAQQAERAIIDALIRSREDAECADCGHKISEHGPDGCHCGCTAWTTEFDKESTEYRYGN